MSAKLTVPQWCLLVDLDQAGGRLAINNRYPPARKLVASGLCEWQSKGFTDALALTEAGRRALEEAEKKP